MTIPILVILLFGVLELGFLYRDYLTMSSGVRDGARKATIVGSQIDADYRILQTIKAKMPGLKSTQITRVVVFKASSIKATVPTACKTAGGTGSGGIAGTGGVYCNSYANGAFSLPNSSFLGTGGAVDSYWPPSTRKVSASAGGPDLIGVWVQIRHNSFTGLIKAATRDLDDTVVLRIEPTTS